MPKLHSNSYPERLRDRPDETRQPIRRPPGVVLIPAEDPIPVDKRDKVPSRNWRGGFCCGRARAQGSRGGPGGAPRGGGSGGGEGGGGGGLWWGGGGAPRGRRAFR